MLEGLDPDVVDIGLEGSLDLDVNWIQTLLLERDWIRRRLERLDPDVIAGRGLNPTSIGRDVNWIRTLLLEGDWIRTDNDWKGWKGR